MTRRLTVGRQKPKVAPNNPAPRVLPTTETSTGKVAGVAPTPYLSQNRATSRRDTGHNDITSSTTRAAETKTFRNAAPTIIVVDLAMARDLCQCVSTMAHRTEVEDGPQAPQPLIP